MKARSDEEIIELFGDKFERFRPSEMSDEVLARIKGSYPGVTTFAGSDATSSMEEVKEDTKIMWGFADGVWKKHSRKHPLELSQTEARSLFYVYLGRGLYKKEGQ